MINYLIYKCMQLSFFIEKTLKSNPPPAPSWPMPSGWWESSPLARPARAPACPCLAGHRLCQEHTEMALVPPWPQGIVRHFSGHTGSTKYPSSPHRKFSSKHFLIGSKFSRSQHWRWVWFNPSSTSKHIQTKKTGIELSRKPTTSRSRQNTQRIKKFGRMVYGLTMLNHAESRDIVGTS